MYANIPTGVCDPVPGYRHGLIVALTNAGFDAEAVNDPLQWAAEGGRRAVFITARLAEDFDTVRQLTVINPELSVVVLLRDASVLAYQEALAAGASAAVAWDDDLEAVIDVLRVVTLNGRYCLLPTRVARALAASHGSRIEAISDREKEWLQKLARGTTIVDLAREASYSEREMFRLLHRLYQRLGAQNRIEALVKAAQAGLLD